MVFTPSKWYYFALRETRLHNTLTSDGVVVPEVEQLDGSDGLDSFEDCENIFLSLRDQYKNNP